MPRDIRPLNDRVIDDVWTAWQASVRPLGVALLSEYVAVL